MRPSYSPAQTCSAVLLFALLATICACGETASSDAAEPTLCGMEAIATTGTTGAVPGWYDDAKLGIMIHWGVWSVPGWAETTLDPERLSDPDDPEYFFAPGGVERFLRHNPYSEWYENSLALDGTDTQQFHRATYGTDFPYTGFQPLFEEESAPWNADAWARLFTQAGARYVVLVTKHHDGYTLWPSAVANPNRAGWHASRDLVGELTTAVRERCLRMGLYYSGGIDWSFKAPPLATLLDLAQSAPQGEPYARYLEAQYRELIARYQPSLLWNDITAPPTADLTSLFADYFAAVPDGVINDRWGLDATALPQHFRSVEYAVRDEITSDKWEAVRGIGRTFGFNRNERLEDYGTPEKYIHLLIDVVSKNGNLLLNVGPMADGTIPAPQVTILRALGAWLDAYGEAIFATRPWTRFAGTTDQGPAVRFTQSRAGDVVYAIVLGDLSGDTVTLQNFAESPTGVRLAGSPTPLAWERRAGDLRITLPEQLAAQPAHAFAIALD